MILRSSWWDGPDPIPGDHVRVPNPPDQDTIYRVVRSAEGPGAGQWQLECELLPENDDQPRRNVFRWSRMEPCPPGS